MLLIYKLPEKDEILMYSFIKPQFRFFKLQSKSINLFWPAEKVSQLPSCFLEEVPKMKINLKVKLKDKGKAQVIAK